MKVMISSDLESKHPVDLTHIMDLKVFANSVFCCLDDRGGQSGDCKIADVGEENGGEDVVFAPEKYCVVMFGSGKFEFCGDLVKNLVPASSALLESVECLQELKDMFVVADADVAWRWFHVDDFILIKFAI